MKNNYSKTINTNEFGPVLFEKSKRAKHINISVRPPNQIRVAVPKSVSLAEAIEFTKIKENWIKNTIRTLNFRTVEQKRLLSPNKISGKQFLVNRLNELADEYGFICNKTSIRNQKTRWGSCSIKNNISLNIQLLRLPDQLIDYVILHELVHTVVKNHSIQFWNTLDIYVDNAKKIDKRLKQYYIA